MDPHNSSHQPEDPLRREAIAWVVRKDRGLTEEEARQFAARLREAPELQSWIDRLQNTWTRLDEAPASLAGELLAEIPSTPLWEQQPWQGILATAALLVIGLALFWMLNPTATHNPQPTTPAVAQAPTTQLLPDGSLVRLNAGTTLETQYSEGIRKVLLKQGEAHFSVQKDPTRPFVVVVNQIRVRAVGTAFNVQSVSEQVDVIVTEGTVEISSDEDPEAPEPSNAPEQITVESSPVSPNYVRSGQRARIRVHREDRQSRLNVDIFGTDTSEVEEVLSWQRPLLTLGGDSLGNIAANFEEKTGMKLEIADPSILDLRIGGRFPSEDPRGFLQVLKSNYGIDWQERSDGTLVIGRQVANSL